MYYYKKSKKVTMGGGIFDSIINAATSRVVKEIVSNAAKEVTKKTITDIGNRGAQKIIDKIIPPPRVLKTDEQELPPFVFKPKRKIGNGLSPESQQILSKYITIQDYVKNY